MAEALCGPSNPLANLQKHTAADRTLQQDRFSSRVPQAESFRSGHGNQPGLVDAQFNAFASGQNPFANQSFLPQDAQRGFHHFPPPAFGQPSQPQATPDWAADFQRLRVSHAQPIAQHNTFQTEQRAQQEHQLRHGLLPNPNALLIQDKQPTMEEAWREREVFRQEREHQYGVTQPTMVEPSLQDFQMQLMLMEQQNKQRLLMARQEQGLGQAGSLFDRGAQASQVQRQAATPQQQAADIEAFEREFAAHDENLSLNRHKSDHSAKLNSDSLVDDSSTAQNIQDRMTELYSGYRDERDLDMAEPFSALQMDVSDPREDSNMTPEERQRRDDDLANTAAELLDRVSDNTSRKFQESTFLALMRQLRDGEVKVDGDKMVDADTQVDVNEENVGTAYI